MPDSFSSPLQRAIARGMQPGNDLADEVDELSEYVIKSAKDAEAICAALQQLPQPNAERKIRSPLQVLTGLFQDVEGSEVPAFEVLYEQGLPELVRIFRELLPLGQEADADDLLFLLKVLSIYGAEEGPECLIQAARLPLKPSDYLWHPILTSFAPDHPQRDEVFSALSDPLPADFIAVSLLDAANTASIEGDLAQHPFDSPAGYAQLQQWLEDQDPQRFSYAHSATAALPFLDVEASDPMLALALDHVDTGVQLEGAWAAAKLGREAGVDFLARYCLDVNHGDVAARYLRELDREDCIPEKAQDPAFQAKTNFARWLAHPNELGRAPDELEIVDSRELAWPPEREPSDFFLIRFLARDPDGLSEDQIDCGLVGSMTWCFFRGDMHERPPEDAYSIHCYWEMTHHELITEAEVEDESEYASYLAQWTGRPLANLKLKKVTEISPDLQIAPRLVVMGSAELDGAEGWIVLDGPRSQFYPADEQPAESSGNVILMIHVGRQLLGLPLTAERRSFLLQEKPQLDSSLFLAAYERLLSEAANPHTSAERQKELLDSWSLLARNFDKYVELSAVDKQVSLAQARMELYERILHSAQNSHESIRANALDALSTVGGKFNGAIEDLIAAGRKDEAAGLLDFFAPLWDSNLGYGQLCIAAYNLERFDLAEKNALLLKAGLEHYFRSEEMSMLAEIWHGRGEVEPARDLLLDCLRKTAVHIQESKYNSDREMFAKEYAFHRDMYGKLFGADEAALEALGIVADPLQLPRIQREK